MFVLETGHIDKTFGREKPKFLELLYHPDYFINEGNVDLKRQSGLFKFTEN